MADQAADHAWIAQQVRVVRGKLEVARLNAKLADGWRVTHIAAMGGDAEGSLVVIEKPMSEAAYKVFQESQALKLQETVDLEPKRR